MGVKKTPICRATLEIPDDYGDNVATMHCELPRGHDGEHLESWNDDVALTVVRVCWQDMEQQHD